MDSQQKRNKQGQSTVEYILLVTAVVFVMILFLVGNNAPFQKKLNGTLDQLSNGMGNVADRMTQ